MKIYTRTGDKGSSSLYSGECLPKNDPTFEALGAIDECNCQIGAVIANLDGIESTKEQMLLIQHTLFDLGAAVATQQKAARNTVKEKTRFDSQGTELLEVWIDEMEKVLPPLTTFILPGGDIAGALTHVARACCRRAERATIPLLEQEQIVPEVQIYLNRLSDYLFVTARFINYELGSPESFWEPHKL